MNLNASCAPTSDEALDFLKQFLRQTKRLLLPFADEKAKVGDFVDFRFPTLEGVKIEIGSSDREDRLLT